MRFIASALSAPSEEGTIFFLGERHSNCYEQMKELDFPISCTDPNIIQGFLIEDNEVIRFVDRYEGAKIAADLGYKLEFPNCLYSEDLW